MRREDLDELEQHACPGPGTCAGHFTANTMAVALDCLGIARIGDGLIPADEREAKAEAATRAGVLAVQLVEQELTARSFVDRRALLNAMAGIAGSGGSTNGILHLLAIAREAGTALSLADLAGVARRTPVLASLAPSGRWMAEDFHRVGGTGALIRELVRGGPLAIVRDGDSITIDVDTGTLTVELDDSEVAERLAAWQPPPLRYAGGVFARYRALVGSASEGAVLLPHAT